MIDRFPLWIPLLAIISIILGIWMLKKYDFSYKKNFWLIIIGFIISIILTAFALDYLGFNDAWSRKGPMRRFYQQLERQTLIIPKMQERMLNKQGDRYFKPADAI